MTEKEIERLAELISIKTSERYLQVTKDMILNEIRAHSFECEARKYGKFKVFISSIVGGSIVALINWIIRRLT